VKNLSVRLVLVLTILGMAALFSNACGEVHENQIPVNQKPVILSVSSDLASVAPGDSSTITCVAEDPDGDPLTYHWSTTGGSLSGAGESVTWIAPDVAGTYSISVTVDDGRGATADESYTIVVVSKVANKSPSIVSVSASPRMIEPNTSTTITCIATDPDGDPLTYRWSTTGYGVYLEGTGNVITSPPPNLVIEGTGHVVTWTAPDDFGEGVINVTVDDNRGGSDTETVTIPVAPNKPPVITRLRAKPTTVIADYSATITCVAEDPEESSLTYSWSPTHGSISGTGGVVTWTAPGKPCCCTIEVTVDDGRGGTTTSSITVEVLGIALTTPLRPVSSESGSIRSNGKIHEALRVGDNLANHGIRAFLSFNIKKLGPVEELRSAVLNVSTTDFGTPWANLGSLCIDEVDYGARSLKAAYYYELPGTRFVSYDSAPIAEIDLTRLVERAVRDESRRFQIMLYFEIETDEDDLSDYIEFTVAELVVNYVRETW